MARLLICIILLLLPQFSLADNSLNIDVIPDAMPLEGFLEYNENIEEDDVNENTIYLIPEDKKHINFTTPYSYSLETSKFNKPKDLSIFNTNQNTTSKFSAQEYLISPVSEAVYTKKGKISFGAAYNSYLDNAEINYQTGLFSKYDTKHFSLTTAISKDTVNDYSKYKDKIYIIPELKITKRLSLIDVFQADTYRYSSKNEIKLRYTPKFRQENNLQLEMSIGQSYYNNAQNNSSVKFSTKIKL